MKIEFARKPVTTNRACGYCSYSRIVENLVESIPEPESQSGHVVKES